MFSFSLFFASTGSTTMGRSVFLKVTGDSFADWFDLCMSARECVETFVSTRDCLELLASKPQRAIVFASTDEFVTSKGD